MGTYFCERQIFGLWMVLLENSLSLLFSERKIYLPKDFFYQTKLDYLEPKYV